MKTKFWVSLVLFTIIFGCSIGSKKKNDLEEMNLKGRVKSIKEFSFQANEKFGEILKGERGREFYYLHDKYVTFNKKGNKIQEDLFESDDSSNGIWTYKYDDRDNCNR